MAGLIESTATSASRRLVTYSHAALVQLDYPCDLDDKVISDHDWVIVDWQHEEVIDCSFSRRRLTGYSARV